ncbi:PREDICTED: uncharacterized protein LOC108355596 [Rhagoletis zephyria]|uniref:uncharacterized protein LOC108355596 n=1 Tax=Rhagoletis zephyria TaxID=28612 RepID=UPI0008115EFC|nr:PREDICTED: uncharacterized protein LOC108355596 [Rhagoletis zephyria]
MDANTVNPAPASTQQPNDWKMVSKSRRPKLTKPLIIGSNNNKELSVISQQKWLHVASFSTNVTAANIISYVSKHADIDAKFLNCYLRIKKDANLDELRKVNFKLGVSECFNDKLLNADIWPANVKIRPFWFFPKGDAPELNP